MFFTPPLVDDFSLEFEWQQVSLLPGLFSVFWPILISLDGFRLTPYFQVLQSLYQSFSDCTKSDNYNWYHRHFHSRFFQFFFTSLARSRNLSFFFFFSFSFDFTLWSTTWLLLLLLLYPKIEILSSIKEIFFNTAVNHLKTMCSI